jgi:hypothetical protein
MRISLRDLSIQLAREKGLELADAQCIVLAAARRHAKSAGTERGSSPRPRADASHLPPDLRPRDPNVIPGSGAHLTQLLSEMRRDDGRAASPRRLLYMGREGSTWMCRDLGTIEFGADVDPAHVGIKLRSPSPTWRDGSRKKLVWLQLAETGAWKGHPAGEFEMTPTTFGEIVRNFEARGLPIPFDFEHASEQDPTKGSIPTTGAPAQGWVHKLENKGYGGLWGLVEWTSDYVRDGIRNGQFAYLSPAIRFGSRDSVTNESIGARLTSVAITNAPFLHHLPGLAAARDVAGAQ